MRDGESCCGNRMGIWIFGIVWSDEGLRGFCWFWGEFFGIIVWIGEDCRIGVNLVGNEWVMLYILIFFFVGGCL